MKKALLLLLAFVGIQTCAFTAVERIHPRITATVLENKKGRLYSKIVVHDVPQFKGDDFEITFSRDGRTAFIQGESYKVKNRFGNSARNEFGHKYRKKFYVTITLPLQVPHYLRGKTLEYSNKSSYFKYYYHHTDTKLTIIIPADDYTVIG